MSYLDQPPADTNELAQFSNPQRWNDFVQAVLEITIQAYQDFYQKDIVKSEWVNALPTDDLEDRFTANFIDCLRPIARQRGFSVIPQFPLYTSAMKSGKQSTKHAKKLDISLFGAWESYDEIYFTWECKLIASSSEPRYSHLAYEYITKGIVRFVHEEWKYAHYVNDSGMLGYVLAGDVNTIVSDINQQMLAKPRSGKKTKPASQTTRGSLSSYAFSASDHLKSFPPLATFNHIYQSSHYRAFRSNTIRLYHLFLIFDFNQNVISSTVLPEDEAIPIKPNP